MMVCGKSLPLRCVLVGVLGLGSAQILAQNLAIEGAWARAMPPAASGTAAYATLINAGAAPLTVTGAHSSAAQRVELHTTVNEEGLMRMRAVTSLQLAPGESVELAPGGLHWMVMRLTSPLQVGDLLPLCVAIEGSEQPVCFEAEVRAPQARGREH